MRKLINLVLVACLINTALYAQIDLLTEAKELVSEGKYSAAQSLLTQMSLQNNADAEVMYLNARCSKELFLFDAVFLYKELNNVFPNNVFKNEINRDLALIYYRNREYESAIPYFLELEDLSSEYIFKLAYSNFSLDSLKDSQYYFSKLINTDSKFASTSRYYYSYIAYHRGYFDSALENFKLLLDDEKFAEIVPYYISQIYFKQKKYQQLIEFAEPLATNVIKSRESEMNRLLAEAYYRTNNYTSAITYFNNFLNNEREVSPIVYFLLGHSYYKSEEFDAAVANLEKVFNSPDSILQYSTYYLGASYLALGEYNYALQAFKKSASFSYNNDLKEGAFFNYAKLSYQLELPFDNTLEILNTYLNNYNNLQHKKEIENLMAQALQGTSKYVEAYEVLSDIYLPTIDQQKALQQLSFYLGVKEYNKQDYEKSIYHLMSCKRYPINEVYSYLSSFWLADCYFQLNDFERSIDIYSEITVVRNVNIKDYEVLKKYNLAYSYFQKADYSNAINSFRSYEKVAKDSMRLHDSYLRIADSYFMRSDFDLSEKYYDKAIEYNLFDTDYAIYKRSVSLGLISKNLLKIRLLKLLTASYRSSSYYDDALFDLAEYYKNISKYSLALEYYDKLIAISKNENFIVNSYLSKGMISFNNGNTQEAIEEFLYVVNNYEKTKYLREALLGLQAAYTSLAQIDKYLQVIDKLPELSVTKSEQDSLTYNAAFMKFSEMDYSTAKSAFDKYLSRFEDGVFINDAFYYNAISSIKIGDTVGAIYNYKKIVELGYSSYQEAALLFLARHSYSVSDFEKSNKYYTSLLDFASFNSCKREALIRLMNGNEESNNSIACKYAQQVIELEKTDDWLLSKAYLIIARNEFEEGNYAKSKLTFDKVVRLSAYDEGAEAKYYLAFLTFLDDDLVLAEKMIFELADIYSSDYFIAKAFILLADIYVAQQNIFQSKATLESIIDNHDGDELVNTARKKWEQIIESEKKVMIDQHEDQSFIEISEDDFEYEVEEIDDDYIVPMLDTTILQMDKMEIININALEDEIE